MFNATINFSDQLKFLKELDAVIEDKLKERIKSLPKEQYCSEKINDLTAALAKSQGEFTPVSYNRTSPWFAAEYCDLDNMLTMARPILSKHGLAISFYEEVDDMTVMHCVLRHVSGQWTSTRRRFVPNKDDLKAIESAKNHIKRMQTMDILGITLKNDALDDDATEAMKSMRIDMFKGGDAKKLPVQDHDNRTITKEQLAELERSLDGCPGIAEQILRAYRLEHLADIPYSKFSYTLSRINTLKEAAKNL